MNQIAVEEIQTSLDSFQVYKLFAARKQSFFLDSGMNPERLGRYSFIGADPFLCLESEGRQISVREKGRETQIEGNPFEVLRTYLRLYKTENTTEFPFAGGAVGFFSYDIGRQLELLPEEAVDDLHLPDMVMGFYADVVVIDHITGKTYAVSSVLPEPDILKARDRAVRLKNFVEAGSVPGIEPADDLSDIYMPCLESNFTPEGYCNAVDRVRDYIREGDVYQVNLSQRFSTRTGRNPLEIYASLRRINPAPFAAYLDYGTFRILSSSPERFLSLRNGAVETRPIKGTLPRGHTPAEDEAQRRVLLNSEKDRAENLMIVDLMRNDLGKVCKIGSVKVPELFAIEAYPTVFHMVSTVTGELLDTCDAVGCITAAFPGGSITGAPKVRAMEIIDELEPNRRHIYTGSIGYLGFDGDMDMNIAIRTILMQGDRASYQVGGGIVWDSVPEKEYRETLDKGVALQCALTSVLGVK